MTQLKNKLQAGFTIIELLIVIAIIGILATLVLTNFQGAQSRGRDTVRKNDINSLYSKLEEYHNNNGGYPDAAITVANAATLFPGIDVEAIKDNDGTVIATTFTNAATAPAPTVSDSGEYAITFYGEGCVAGTACSKYVLVGFQENGDSYVKNSLN